MTYMFRILSHCTQWIYLIKLLKHHEMCSNASTTVSYHILHYCFTHFIWSPSSERLFTCWINNRITACFKRLNRYGCIDCVVTIDGLIDRSDDELLKKKFALRVTPFIICFHRSDLHLRGYPFQSPECDTDLHKKSFIVPSLYEYIRPLHKIGYWYLAVLSLFYCSFRVFLILCFICLLCRSLFFTCVHRIIIKITYLLIYFPNSLSLLPEKKTIFLFWPWTLTHDIDRRTWRG